MKKAAAALILSLAFITTGIAASSDWNIDVLQDPYSFDKISNSSETAQVINLTTVNDKTISRENLTDTSRVEYKYNGTTKSMQWLHSGIWYTMVETNATGGNIEFEAQGETTSSQIVDSQGIEANATRNLEISNVSIQILEAPEGTYTAGEQVEVRLNLTDEWNNENIDGSEGDAFVHFTNVSWTSNKKKLGYSGGEHQLTISLPDATNETFFFHINATDTAANYKNPSATVSRIVKTYPAVEGEINYLNASTGCNQQEFFSSCERGTTINTGFEIVNAEAENVKLSLLAENSSKMNETLKTLELQQKNNVYTGKLQVPDLNTSEYSEQLYLKYNASNGGRTDLDYHSFSYESYGIDAGNSPNTAYQGGQYTIKAAFEKPFTKKPLNESRITRLNATVYRPNGTIFKDFNLSDMRYSDDELLYKKSFHVPIDAETEGVWQLNITSENVYGKWSTGGDDFSVLDVSATFNASNQLEIDYNKTGVLERNLSITNRMNTEKQLNLSLEGDTENFTDYNETVSIPGGETMEVPFEFNISYVEDYDGSVEIVDEATGYNETVDIELEAPHCEMRNGTLCLTEQEKDWINVTMMERGNALRTLEIFFLGQRNLEVNGSATVTGEHVTIEPESFTMNTVNDTETVVLNFTASTPGNFSGSLDLELGNDSIELKTSFESNIEARDYGISTPSSLDFGYVPKAESVSKSFEIENTGTIPVESLEASMNEAEVTLEGPETIAAGSSEEYNLQISSFQTGIVSISGRTSQGNASSTISITGTTVTNIPAKEEEIRQRITDLQEKANSSSVETQLADLELQLDSAITAYESRNYEKASQSYEEITSSLDQLETQVRASEQQPEQPSQPSQPSQQPEEPDSGGSPIIPVLIGLIVILAIGFIGYSSIIPEEGDPLYNVLGK